MDGIIKEIFCANDFLWKMICSTEKMGNEFAHRVQAEKSVFSPADKSPALRAFFLQSLRLVLLCAATKLL
jgi:hypothetical protein